MRAIIATAILILATPADTTPPVMDRSPDTLAGTWDLNITVAPNPPVPNRFVFEGGPESGTFIDVNEHTGSWRIQNDSVFWTFQSVPDLVNEFRGVMLSDSTMAGINEGSWQGQPFRGTWEGTAVPDGGR